MASRQAKRAKILAIAVVLLLPLFAWVIFKIASKGVIKAPNHYGISYVDTNKTKDGTIKYDTIYKTLKDLQLTNQLGKRVNLNRDLRGKILVISFFNTQNTTISPRVMKNLNIVQRSFGKNMTWTQFISITLNPKHDKVHQIRRFADRFNVIHHHWWLLTGDSATIYNYAEHQLQLPFLQERKKAYHTAVLIDTFRHIRGYFNILDTAELTQLADDISIISMEK